MSPAARPRLLYIDNLRTMAIIMVILVHLSVTYGGEGSWYYEEGRADLLTGAVLTMHNAVTQSFFMGLLFLLSAYFTVASCDRKGTGPFLRDRFLRLGIPLLFFEFLIQPFTVSVLFKAGIIAGSWRDYLRWYYTSFHLGSGPLWFVEVLLIFSLLYAAGRTWAGRRPSLPRESGRVPGLAAILVFAAVLGILSFVVRLRFPVNWAFGPLNLQLAFFVQYIALFIAGVVAYRRNWPARLPNAMLVPALAAVGLLILVALPLLLALGGGLNGQTGAYLGGWHWQALAYAVWEQTLAMTMIVSLLIVFRERLNRQSALAREASAGSYTVYILHAPIIILFALAVRNVALYPLLKFAMAAAVTIPLCFLVAAGVRRLPLARQVL